MSSHARSQAVGLLDTVLGLVFKVAIPLIILTTVFLLMTAFGHRISQFPFMTVAKKQEFVHSVDMAMFVQTYAIVACLIAIIILRWRDNGVGQVLSLIGGVLYFGSAWFFSAFTIVKVNIVLLSIVNQFRMLGMICFVPGLFLAAAHTAAEVKTRLFGSTSKACGEKNIRSDGLAPLIGQCWHLHSCGETLRNRCSAFTAKRSCWRVKTGCLCDPRMMVAARAHLTGDGSQHPDKVGNVLHANKAQANQTDYQKRERCRHCTIYADHQSQKYRLLCPIMFGATIVSVYFLYGMISVVIFQVIQKADKIMRVLVYDSSGNGALGADGRVLTVLATIWLTIIVVSYVQKALDYLIFELQV